ncbi:MAG TPA: hypothetical protein VF412_03160 [Bdellovibrio sp.]|uniref:hypothetical protein n=1 Tax=Bdellovibrio sp. TaxID=28201 RepID=UPI002EFD5EFC
MNYKEHIVAFLDILGFSAICLKSETDDEAKVILQDIFRICHSIPAEFESITGKKKIKSMIVSDSIVLSLELENDSPTLDELANFFLACGKFQYYLGRNGIWLRGGISIGALDVDHGQKQVVGPALVRAVNLEKKSAKYPRIVIDPLVMKVSGIPDAPEFRKRVNEMYSGANQRAIFEWRSTIDDLGEPILPKDVPFFIDFIRSTIGEESPTVLAEAVARGLRGPIEHYEKYRWLADYILVSNRQVSMGLNINDTALNGLLG